LDNISHSLAGALLAETALVLIAPRPAQTAPAGRPALRAAAYTTSILANNLPDFDYFYARSLTPPLGYLLHHRGYTHTLAALVPLTLVALAVAAVLDRWRAWHLVRSEWLVLSVLALIGPITHVAMDSTNNYGVHPFFPFDNRWYYGDFVFIVEPWFWVATLPPLLFAARARIAKLLSAVALFLIVALAFFVKVVPLGSALVLGAAAIAALVVAKRLGSRGRVVLGWSASLFVVSSLFAMSRRARAEARAIGAREFPAARTRDMVLTPMPANPLCWEMLLVQTEGSEYRVRRGALATVPSLRSARDCKIEWDDSHPTATYVTVAAPDTDQVRWLGEYQNDTRALDDLAARDCRLAALFRFARAPYIAPLPGRPGATVAGDLRYDRAVGLDFSDVLVGYSGPECPSAVPPWRPPRADLLAGTEPKPRP
jgi:inner membrane protein